MQRTGDESRREGDGQPLITGARSRLAWSIWLFGLAMLVFAFVFGEILQRPPAWADLSQALSFLAIGTAGLAIARRQPGNAVGWIYLGVWAAMTFSFGLLDEYGYWATVSHPGTFAGTGAVWLTNWVWVPVFSVLLTFPFLLFPDGHLASPRWRPVAWAVAVVTPLWAFAFAMQGSQYSDALNHKAPNPYTIPGVTEVANVAVQVLAIAFVAVVGLCVASLVVRFRRSRGDERQQIKWLMLAGGVFLVWIALPLEHGSGGVADVVQGLLLALIPAAVGIAILKYRLYDIDVVIKKTVVFTVVAAVLTALYLGVIAIATIGTVSRVLVGVVLLAVTFNPVRRAARALADRLVYGKRATSYEVLADFSERMAETYATDDVLPRMAHILKGATGASSATIWLLVGTQLRAAEVSGDGGARPTISLEGDALPELPGDLGVEVRHQGELLGALSVTMPANDPMNPGREKLVRDLASQAGLVLRNVRLIEELKASRLRLVAAQDDERRKIERNIHDGAQQQLVALAVQLKLAGQLAGKDPEKERELLERLGAQTASALEDLRDLARGIYPPLLADRGLAVALGAQANKAAVATSVSAGGVGRYSQDVESTVYFCVLEALNNVAKYSEATRTAVSVTTADGELRFEVVDDGKGFDPASTGYGTGLQGMSDRLATVGGALVVHSAPGSGSTVIGVVPIEEASLPAAD